MGFKPHRRDDAREHGHEVRASDGGSAERQRAGRGWVRDVAAGVPRPRQSCATPLTSPLTIFIKAQTIVCCLLGSLLTNTKP